MEAVMESFTVVPITSLGSADSPRVREAWSRIREICCETALSGKPIEDRTRWPFFGELWIRPYEKLFPEWTWVAIGSQGRVEGYLTGCPDTRALHRHLRWRHHPLLLLQILLRRWPWTIDTRSFVRRWLRLAPHPERIFERSLLDDVLSWHPAHLHTNVTEALRGRGAGAALVDAYRIALARQGVPGIHLFCGAAPIRFYEKCGFRVLSIREVRPGLPVHLMGASVPPS